MKPHSKTSDDPGIDVMIEEISPPVQLSATEILNFLDLHLLLLLLYQNGNE